MENKKKQDTSYFCFSSSSSSFPSSNQKKEIASVLWNGEETGISTPRVYPIPVPRARWVESVDVIPIKKNDKLIDRKHVVSVGWGYGPRRAVTSLLWALSRSFCFFLFFDSSWSSSSSSRSLTFSLFFMQMNRENRVVCCCCCCYEGGIGGRKRGES